MNNAYKSFISTFVIIAFIATAVMCCCVVKNAVVSKKMACSHCKSQGSTGSQECCFSKASPMEIAKSVTGIIHFLPLLAFTIFSLIYIKPTPQLAYSRYQNGPPGFVSRVPLYIRSRSIRI